MHQTPLVNPQDFNMVVDMIISDHSGNRRAVSSEKSVLLLFALAWHCLPLVPNGEGGLPLRSIFQRTFALPAIVCDRPVHLEHPSWFVHFSSSQPQPFDHSSVHKILRCATVHEGALVGRSTRTQEGKEIVIELILLANVHSART